MFEFGLVYSGERFRASWASCLNKPVPSTACFRFFMLIFWHGIKLPSDELVTFYDLLNDQHIDFYIALGLDRGWKINSIFHGWSNANRKICHEGYCFGIRRPTLGCQTVILWQIFLAPLHIHGRHSRTSVARTPLEPWKYVRDRGNLS